MRLLLDILKAINMIFLSIDFLLAALVGTEMKERTLLFDNKH